MIDHITFRVQDIQKTKAFYSKALEPLGYRLVMEETFDGVKVLGFGKDGKTNTWFTDSKPTTTNSHIAWSASSPQAVDAFYKGALAAGGKDNGKPGPRPEYHENYYGAFVLDPDGNNVEAVCHQAPGDL